MMSRFRVLLLTLLLLAIVPFVVLGDEKEEEPPALAVLPLPGVKLQPIAKEKHVGADEIKKLIGALSEIDKPDIGFSSSVSGSTFAPLRASDQVNAGLLSTNERIVPSAGFVKLVSIGSESLPYLLEALKDKTDSKIVIKHETGGFGGMWYGRELNFNPMNAAELDALKKMAPSDAKETFPGMGADVPNQTHTLTIGDLAFVAIGQITNRGYQASRYQPTACLVVNSPTNDPEIAKAIQRSWAYTEPKLGEAQMDLRERLLKWLLTDFMTRGEGSSGLQCGAALRLLFYFPDETTQIVADRIRGLDVTETDSERRLKANGVYADAMIAAVAPCGLEPVQKVLLDHAVRTKDPEIYLQCIEGLSSDSLPKVLPSLESILDEMARQAKEQRYFMSRLLNACVRHFPRDAERIIAKFLKSGEMEKQHSVCQALRGGPANLALKFLVPMLDNKAETGWTKMMDDRKIRVCDEAAESLISAVPELNEEELKMGKSANTDRQIQAIKKKCEELLKGTKPQG